jgi:hypothetical protein
MDYMQALFSLFSAPIFGAVFLGMKARGSIPIRFFVGAILCVYGIIVLIASIHVPEGYAVSCLSRQAGTAWGIVMKIVGGVLILVCRR